MPCPSSQEIKRAQKRAWYARLVLVFYTLRPQTFISYWLTGVQECRRRMTEALGTRSKVSHLWSLIYWIFLNYTSDTKKRECLRMLQNCEGSAIVRHRLVTGRQTELSYEC